MIGLSPLEQQALQSQLKTIAKDHKRQHQWGKATYFHPQRFSQGLFLPSNLGEQLRQELIVSRPLTGLDGKMLTYEELEVVAEVVRHQLDNTSFSGGRDYGLRFITGDLAEIRTMNVDGIEKECLVFPQGGRRSRLTAESFLHARMGNHPLAGKSDTILEAEVRTMVLSGFRESIYTRLSAGGDATTNGANKDSVINAAVEIATWQFTDKTPYKLNLPPTKVLTTSPDIIPETAYAQLKGSGRYLDRILRYLDVLESEDAKQFQVNDVAYAARNGLVVDTTYTNLVYLGADHTRQNGVVMAFPIPSRGNMFFQGKTVQTVYELVQQFAEQYKIRVVEVESVRDLAAEFRIKLHGDYDHPIKAARLMEEIIMEKVGAVLAPGTFLGPQVVKGWHLPLHRTTKTFDYSGRIGEAINTILQLYTDAVWVTNGGIPLDKGSRLAADPEYCTLFDVNEVREGRVSPLKFRNVSG